MMTRPAPYIEIIKADGRGYWLRVVLPAAPRKDGTRAIDQEERPRPFCWTERGARRKAARMLSRRLREKRVAELPPVTTITARDVA